VKPEFCPAGLGWVCVAAHRLSGLPQIGPAGEAALGSVGLDWVCL